VFNLPSALCSHNLPLILPLTHSLLLLFPHLPHTTLPKTSKVQSSSGRGSHLQWNEFSAKLKELEEYRKVREAQRPPEPTSTPPPLPPPCPPLTVAQIRATLAGRGWKEDAIEGAARLIVSPRSRCGCMVWPLGLRFQIKGRRSEGEARRNAGQVSVPRRAQLTIGPRTLCR